MSKKKKRIASRKVHRKENPMASTSNSPAKSQPQLEAPHHTPRILIIDDDEDTLAVIKMVMIKDGYQVDLAGDGVQGLRLLKQFHHSLVISDVMMPKMDGYVFCKTVRHDHDISMTPIILVTAKKELDDKLLGLTQGADDYITKPYNLAELRARIISMLHLSKLRSDLIERERELERIHTIEQTLIAISHNINNAIAPILGRAQICKPDDRHSVEKLIEASIDGCERVTNTIRLLEQVVTAMKHPENRWQFEEISQSVNEILQKLKYHRR